jgi:hypothetical protein
MPWRFCINRRRKTRNKYAHWLWGTCKEVPGRLFLCNPAALTRDLLNQQSQVIEYRDRILQGEDDPEIEAVERGFTEKDIYMLSRSGAQSDLRDAKQCLDWLGEFDALLFWRDVEDMDVGGGLADDKRSQLRSEGPIQDGLSRKTKTDSPEALPQ